MTYNKFINNRSWIYLILIAVLSFAQVMTIWNNGQHLVYLHLEKWLLYGSAYCFWFLVFAPAIVFCFFRRTVQSNNIWLGRVLWLLAFVGYPFIFGFLAPKLNLKFSHDGVFIWIASLVFIAVEAALTINHRIVKRSSYLTRWIQSGVEKTLAIALVILSILYALLSFPPNFMDLFELLSQVMLIVAAYYSFYLVNNYILYERIGKIHGLVYYGFSVLGLMVLYYPLFAILFNYLPILTDHRIVLSGEFWIPQSSGPEIFTSMKLMAPLPGMLLSIPLVIVSEWMKRSKYMVALEGEIKTAELRLLKQKFNPHFFFNTLNNLYAMSISKDSQTSEVILKLSELMRYSIDVGDKTEVSIESEIAYLEDYVAIELLRLKTRPDYRFKKEVLDISQNIPPLLFTVFVENAFKHGLRARAGEFLHLELKSSESFVEFTCSNPVPADQVQGPGTGLKNLKDRLNLIYGQNYKLETGRHEGVFTSYLKIPLLPHLPIG